MDWLAKTKLRVRLSVDFGFNMTLVFTAAHFTVLVTSGRSRIGA